MKIDITKLKITNESLFIGKKNQNSLFEIDDPKFGNLGTISNIFTNNICSTSKIEGSITVDKSQNGKSLWIKRVQF